MHEAAAKGLAIIQKSASKPVSLQVAAKPKILADDEIWALYGMKAPAGAIVLSSQEEVALPIKATSSKVAPVTKVAAQPLKSAPLKDAALEKVVVWMDNQALHMKRRLGNGAVECSVMHPGPDGFAIATFPDGVSVTTEMPNLLLSLQDATPPKKPKQKPRKRPAAAIEEDVEEGTQESAESEDSGDARISKRPSSSDLLPIAVEAKPVPGQTYRGYDLSGLPAAAFPQGDSRGMHSYTLKATNGAVLEVLLAKKCYYIKKYADGFAPASTPTVSWSKHGGAAESWVVAKQLSGYN